MSSAPSRAVQPKRARGRQRVEALLNAAAAVFAERGYEGTTMTEIATRSGTAIGSLYRFFPTKAVIAEALLDQYSGQVDAVFSAIRESAENMSPREIADALIDLMLGLRDEYAAAIVLLEGRGDGAVIGERLRSDGRSQIEEILRTAVPNLGEDVVPIAAVLLQVMKAVLPFAAEDGAHGRLAGELRRLLRIYLEGTLR